MTSALANPLAGDITRIYTEVLSQPGRMLNDFRHLGFNQAENGKKVFDGMMQWIAAGDGINMNYRFSQPGRTERNRQDHLLCRGRVPVRQRHDDRSDHRQDGQSVRAVHRDQHVSAGGRDLFGQRVLGEGGARCCTPIPTGTSDLPDSPFTRNYLISSHQHGVGNAAAKGSCQQFQNPLDSAPVQRALFIALDEWVDGQPPPAEQVPRLSDGTLVPPLPQSAVGFPDIPGVTYTGLKTTRYLLDYGPELLHDRHRDNQPAAGHARRTRTTRPTARSIRASCQRPTATATKSPACGCPT